MQAQSRHPGARRRGVVLVLILAMLGLLALIGVSFATLAGQAHSGARKVVEAMNAPTSDAMMDYALSQLINDTANPMSAIRGHSLLRDMYGNDGKLNGYLDALPPSGGPLRFVSPTLNPNGTISCGTNIPTGGFDFTNWIVKLKNTNGPTQTFEVLVDNFSGTNHVLTLSPASNAALVYTPDPATPAGVVSTTLPVPVDSGTFVLDGRYRRAFNGQGLTTLAQFGNFRFNGANGVPRIGTTILGDPDALGMDEDYDGADLENWYMALQSADGSVIIPSFHRPGLLTDTDWTTVANAKILRPSAADGHDSTTFLPITPKSDGSLSYDVDNDGDGITDAVWTDLGHPAQRDANGKLYKPLFAFTVLGLNGKLPLNTAGNIQGRHQVDGPLPDPMSTVPAFFAGDPSNDHVSHLGYSVNEINPKYALQNAPIAGFGQTDNVGVPVNLTQLRNLLTGTVPQSNPMSGADANNGDTNTVTFPGSPTGLYYMPNNMADNTEQVGGFPVTRLSSSVAGRWGEETLIPQQLIDPSPYTLDSGARPANFLAFNSPVRAGRSINYFVAPYALWDAADDNQDGLDFYPPGDPEQRDFFDIAGGVQLPSERIRRFVTPIDPSGNGQILQYASTPSLPLGADNRGRVAYSMYYRPPGLPTKVNTPSTTGPSPTPAGVGDVTNNFLHGFEAARNSLFTPLHPTGPHFAEVPFINQNVNDPTFEDNTTTPNIVAPINTLPNPFASAYSMATVSKNYPMGSLATNNADEMNPYQPTQFDSPYGMQDLEWLYRSHDVDGSSLQSRLSQLAPISFSDKVNAPGDGIMRRKMFCGDTFDTTNFVYAYDNPAGAFANNHRPLLAPNASLANLGAATPQLAHGDRKINLNFPLPVSNDPLESVRKRWISDAYNLLLDVLPPLAVDTAEERAALSQYLINVIDFRDPDGTITIFANPDLMQVPAVPGNPSATPPVSSAPPRVVLASAGVAGAVPLVQYGMEYSPVAVNEVLAYAYNRKDRSVSPPANKMTPRLFIEMVNTLTASSTSVTGPPSYNASDLDLAKWDLVVAPDDVTGRPDPVTGQIPVVPTAAAMTFSLGTGGLPAISTGATTRLKALDVNGAASYYVLTNKPADFDPTIDEQGLDASKINGTIPAGPAGADYLIPTKTGGFDTNKYYWLYLRRPANPFDPPNTNMVVVDAFRFPFLESNGTGANGTPDTQGVVPTTPIYSLERYQPYRGGQAVPVATAADAAAAPPSPPNPYGYSEQTAPSTATSTFFGVYSSVATNPVPTPAPPKTTLDIKHRLGEGRTEVWDHFPFHDRDFMSVAELLLVPGCPPGLFTKKFVENAPDATIFPPNPTDPANAGVAYPYITPPAKRPVNSASTNDRSDVIARRLARGRTVPPSTTPNEVPHSYPYLVDKFFYTAANPAAAVTTPVIGGPTSAGWYKMFEFFDVPSPMMGTIGPVAQGQDFDWLRQDRKPGQLNLNLIIDEEVFLGLIDDYTRLNTLPAVSGTAGLPQIATSLTTSTPMIPPISTIFPNGRGYFDPNTGVFAMKAAFSDFLKLRHGGSSSNILFGFGSGATGSTLPVERPFHSLSYPDIDYTLMRPATLPPSAQPTTVYPNPTPPDPSDNTIVAIDPGLMNGTISAPGSGFPPAIPPRRLFELPDNTQNFQDTTATPNVNYPGSNASQSGDYRVNTPITLANLSNPAADLSAQPVIDNTTTPPTTTANVWLGGRTDTTTSTTDRREHPYFRTEWMQKMMNLTTTRTHQYAVWVTVGFFEVTREGNPQTLTPDRLGPEIGKAAGRSVRYRSFFLVDRTRAIGFNPKNPDNFHDCIVYRRRIE